MDIVSYLIEQVDGVPSVVFRPQLHQSGPHRGAVVVSLATWVEVMGSFLDTGDLTVDMLEQQLDLPTRRELDQGLVGGLREALQYIRAPDAESRAYGQEQIRTLQREHGRQAVERAMIRAASETR